MSHLAFQLALLAAFAGDVDESEYVHKLDDDNAIVLTANLSPIPKDCPKDKPSPPKKRDLAANRVYVQTILRYRGKDFPFATHSYEARGDMANAVLQRERDLLKKAQFAASKNRLAVARARRASIQIVEFPSADKLRKNHCSLNYLLGKDATVANVEADVLYLEFVPRFGSVHFAKKDTETLWHHALLHLEPKIIEFQGVTERGVEFWSMTVEIKGTVPTADVNLSATFRAKLGQSHWHEVSDARR